MRAKGWPRAESGPADFIAHMYVRPLQELEEPEVGKGKEGAECRVPADSPRTSGF